LLQALAVILTTLRKRTRQQAVSYKLRAILAECTRAENMIGVNV